MQTTIVVKSTTKESKQAQGKTYWGVKHEDGNWFNLITDSKPAQGARYNVDVKETQFNGRTYRWANIIQAQKAASQNGAGQSHPWEDYARMARVAHELACDLEPDETGAGTHFEDRSQARAAILNTVMIAFSNGKIELPKDSQAEPPPLDDDGSDSIPF
jgi:hypothetical protein